MKTYSRIGFIVGISLTALVLGLASVDGTRVALLRMDSQLREHSGFKDEIRRHCNALTFAEPNEKDEIRSFFQERLSPLAEGQASACRLWVETVHRDRFHLKSYWKFLVHVEAGRTALDHEYNVDFPDPLCFLPITVFLWALLFGEMFWGLGLTLASYVFLLGGINLNQTLKLAVTSVWLAPQSDPTFIGLSLIVVWLALYRTRDKQPTAVAPKFFNEPLRHVGMILIGIWNPLVYTIMGKASLPLKGTISRIRPFLDTQLLVAALSLFILAVELNHHQAWMENTLMIPRYFSAAALAFLIFRYAVVKPDQTTLNYQCPPIWKGILFAATVEILALKIPWLAELPRLVRVGTAFVLSELVFPPRLKFLKALQKSLPGLGAIFVAAFFTVISRKAGATDLALVLLTPQARPESLVFTTFFAGLGLGFLTGNFSFSFFALFPTVLPGHESAMVKAALLDGILAGNLLSPFSLFNLLPMAQFEMKLQNLISFRFEQLVAPLIIGGIIYALSSLNSIAILQPVTFVFLCLVVFAYQMRQSRWTLGLARFSSES